MMTSQKNHSYVFLSCSFSKDLPQFQGTPLTVSATTGSAGGLSGREELVDASLVLGKPANDRF